MKKKNSIKDFYLLALLGISCLMCGCGKADLLSNVDEEQANDVISLLQQANLPASKKAGLESTWTVVINDVNNFSKAVELLKSKGFPKVVFNNMGKVFQKSGLVSSPLEERARLMHAMAESISETLSKIPGVLTARVHVVLPENDPYAESNIPSSAAIFISYRAEFNLEESVREIKYLVTNSIQGLSYDKVSIALFPVTFHDDVAQNQQANLISVMGILVAQDSVTKLWMFIAILSLLLIIAIGVAVFFCYEWINPKSNKSSVHQENIPVAVQQDAAPAENNPEAEDSLGSLE